VTGVIERITFPTKPTSNPDSMGQMCIRTKDGAVRLAPYDAAKLAWGKGAEVTVTREGSQLKVTLVHTFDMAEPKSDPIPSPKKHTEKGMA
jgi:hypothetical protein